MTDDNIQGRGAHRKIKFDPYTGEPLDRDDKLAKESVEDEYVSANENKTTSDNVAHEDEFSRTAFDDAIDLFVDLFRQVKRSISNAIKRVNRGYDDRDLYDMGFSTVSLLIEILPKTYEYRENPKLAEAVSVFEDYMTWRSRGFWKVGHSIGSDAANDIEDAVQKKFAASWLAVWKAFAKSPAYEVDATKNRTKNELHMGKGFRFAWQRLTRGYDDWQVENASYAIPNKLAVLLLEYARNTHGYPKDYPEYPTLGSDPANWDDQTWLITFLGNSEGSLDPHIELGQPYIAWVSDCISAAQTMEIATAMKNSASPVSKAMNGYGTSKQRRSVQDQCEDAWFWIGQHIPDLWD